MNGDIIQFGTALGLDMSFLKQVDLRGKAAIIDRVQTIDVTGAHGRLLSMVQHFGMFLIDRVAHKKHTGEGPLGDAISSIARLHGVNPQLGVRLIGAIWTVYRATLQQRALADREGEEDGKTELRRESGTT